MLVLAQNGCKSIGGLPSWSQGWLGALALSLCPASGERMVLYIATPGKDKNMKFEIWFLLKTYHFAPL